MGGRLSATGRGKELSTQARVPVMSKGALHGNCWVCAQPVYGNDGLLYHLPGRILTCHRDGVLRNGIGDCMTRLTQALEVALSGVKHPDHFPYKWWQEYGVTETYEKACGVRDSPKRPTLSIPRSKAPCLRKRNNKK